MTRDQIIAWIITNDEGGLVDAAGDPGGRTNKGISQRFLDAVRPEYAGTLPATVDELSDAAIAALYVGYFWNPLQGDRLPPSLGLVLMDMAVNEGPPTAVMLLQKSLRLTADGRLGPVTLGAALASDPGLLLAELMAQRCVAYATLDASKPQFELGWMRRAVRVYTAALSA